MALQTSGQISAADIQNEFGQSGEMDISDYYRGGGIVPDTPANSGVPTSGEIRYDDFYGAANIMEYDLTIGDDGAEEGYDTVINFIGSLSPDSFDGQTILSIFTLNNALIVRIGGDLPQSFFSSIEVDGFTYQVADSLFLGYNSNEGGTRWDFEPAVELGPDRGGDVITVVIHY